MPSGKLCACVYTHPGLSAGITGLRPLFHLLHSQVLLRFFVYRTGRRISHVRCVHVASIQHTTNSSKPQHVMWHKWQWQDHSGAGVKVFDCKYPRTSINPGTSSDVTLGGVDGLKFYYPSLLPSNLKAEGSYIYTLSSRRSHDFTLSPLKPKIKLQYQIK